MVFNRFTLFCVCLCRCFESLNAGFECFYLSWFAVYQVEYFLLWDLMLCVFLYSSISVFSSAPSVSTVTHAPCFIRLSCVPSLHQPQPVKLLSLHSLLSRALCVLTTCLVPPEPRVSVTSFFWLSVFVRFCCNGRICWKDLKSSLAWGSPGWACRWIWLFCLSQSSVCSRSWMSMIMAYSRTALLSL